IRAFQQQTPPMYSPSSKSFSTRSGLFPRLLAIALSVLILTFGAACDGKLVKETSAEPVAPRPAPPPPTVPTWLGNSSRNFYGTGPWSDKPSEVLWEF